MIHIVFLAILLIITLLRFLAIIYSANSKFDDVQFRNSHEIKMFAEQFSLVRLIAWFCLITAVVLPIFYGKLRQKPRMCLQL
jgi:hypothetical protein